MALVDLCKFSTATTGTATALTVGSAADGGRLPANSGATDGQTYSYGITDGTLREYGKGVFSSTQTVFTRTFVGSTNGSILSLSGSAKVFITPLTSDHIPANGASGYIITKNSATDGDFGWASPLAGFPVFSGTGGGDAYGGVYQNVGTGGFNLVKLPNTPAVDSHGAWNSSNSIYVIPQSGVYQFNMKMRLTDGQSGGISYGIGAGTNQGDEPDFAWTTTNGTRAGHQNFRVSYYNVGDQIRMYAYISSGTSEITSAALVIVKIR